MGSVIKGYKYRLIDNRSFDMPLPIRYELLKEDDLVAFYEVAADESVTVRVLTKHKENMITPVYRSLEIADIYYLFSSRVFQNGTPFTAMELQLLGLDRYNVYDIIHKTRGVTPYDTYWLRFEGDHCNDYHDARAAWEELFSGVQPTEKPQAEQELDIFAFPDALRFVPTATRELDSEEESHVSDILNQHKMNYSERLAQESEKSEPIEEAKHEGVTNNTMTMDEIDALLQQSGISSDAPAPKAEEPKSGGMMSDDEIAKMLAAVNTPEETSAPEPTPEPAEEPPSSGGMMNQDDIEKMLAAASTPEPTPEPAEEPQSSGGKMSQDDIEKMLAAASAPEPTPEPTPEPAEEPQSSGGKMSQDDIEKMLAAASAPEPTPEPAEEPTSSGGKMSQDDIEKMLAAASAPEPTSEPAEEPQSSGGKMSQDDIEKMLAAASALEPTPEPAEEPQSSGGKMSQDDIEKMIAAASDPEPTPEPAEEPTSDGKMSEADIEALLNGMKEDAGQ